MKINLVNRRKALIHPKRRRGRPIVRFEARRAVEAVVADERSILLKSRKRRTKTIKTRSLVVMQIHL